MADMKRQKYEVVYTGPIRDLKTVKLCSVRVSMLLNSKIDEYCRATGELKAHVVRRAIRLEIGKVIRITAPDLLEMIKPFCRRSRKLKNNGEQTKK